MYLSGTLTAKTITSFSIVDAYEDVITIRNDGTINITSFSEVSVDGNPTSFVIMLADPSLALWLPFDEGFDVKAKDASGKGNDGTLYNGSVVCSGGDCPNWVDGKFDSALELDGINDYVNVGNEDSLNIIQTITIEAWVKPNSVPGIIIGKRTPPGVDDRTYEFAVNSSGYIGFMSNGPGFPNFYLWSGFQPISAGVWTHVAVTFNGTHLKFYVNGINVDTIPKTGSLRPNSGDVIIGHDQFMGGNPWFDGILDEIRVYSRALTMDEIRENMLTGGRDFKIAPSTTARIKIFNPLYQGTHTIRICTPTMCQTGYIYVP
jgi:hypothetical protein